MAIKQIKLNGSTYDLNNRSITLASASGTLTVDQMAILQASDKNFIIYSNFYYTKTGETSTHMYYGFEDTGLSKMYYFSIKKSNRTYSRTQINMATEEYVDDLIGTVVSASY